MSTELRLASGSISQRYEALLRISEALSACCEPEELSRVLADQLDGVINFDHLDVLVLRENSKEIEWHVWGKGSVPLPDAPIEELPTWHVYNSQEPLHIADWNKDERFPRLKVWAGTIGVNVGSVVRVPLTTPHRRLGTLGIISAPGIAYGADDVVFLRLIARVVAFAIDDGLNLRRAQAAQACLQHQNDRLQLLLNLTNRITSNLDLRELLRAVSANIREVMQCDAVAISLPDPASGNFRVYAIDFPGGKGFAKEELIISPAKSDPSKRAFDTLKPVIVSMANADEFAREAYEIVVAEGIKSSCHIPLVNRGRALGLMVVARTTEDSFTPEDVEFITQVAGQIAIAVENALAYREISELKDKLAQEKLYLEEEIRSEMNFDQIVGNSPALRRVLELVETVAPSDSTVLLLGETGTGKELIARAIHDHSRRKDRTFVKLNCAAIPTGLLESELFGHEKGAFTGAISQKVGRLELADHGTLFLDEVGDVSLEIQPKLLRALQEREFERLGSARTKKVDVRLVAATNRDLEGMIAAREFRSDLYYRLNVFPIRIPPLRERREDIPLLARYFVQKFARQMQKQIETIPAGALKALTDWDWPGNIRELQNFIERAVILTRGKSLEVQLTELHKTGINTSVDSLGPGGREEIVRIVKETISDLNNGASRSAAEEYDEKQRQDIISVLRETKGRVSGAGGAAERMGVNRTTLLSRMKKLGIDPKQFS
ncbi:MAG TPA: sigma 54-interacting transcriptional regulator [Blastocatellia bacterium]